MGQTGRSAALGGEHKQPGSRGTACRYNELTGATSEKDPLVEFRGHMSASGRAYWTDENGASTWNAPEAFAWKEQTSVNHPGTVFYFNEARRAPPWPAPEPLVPQVS